MTPQGNLSQQTKEESISQDNPIQTHLDRGAAIYWGELEAKEGATQTVWASAANQFRAVLVVEPDNLLALDWLLYLYEHHDIKPEAIDFKSTEIPDSLAKRRQALHDQIEDAMANNQNPLMIIKAYKAAKIREKNALQKTHTKQDVFEAREDQYFGLYAAHAHIHIDEESELCRVKHTFESQNEADTFVAWIKQESFLESISTNNIKVNVLFKNKNTCDQRYVVTLLADQFDALFGKGKYDLLLGETQFRELSKTNELIYKMANVKSTDDISSIFYLAKQGSFLNSYKKFINLPYFKKHQIPEAIANSVAHIVFVKGNNINTSFRYIDFIFKVFFGSITEIVNAWRAFTAVSAKLPRSYLIAFVDYVLAQRFSVSEFKSILDLLTPDEFDTLMQSCKDKYHYFLHLLNEFPRHGQILLAKMSAELKNEFAVYYELRRNFVGLLGATDLFHFLDNYDLDKVKDFHRESYGNIANFLVKDPLWLAASSHLGQKPLYQRLVKVLLHPLVYEFKKLWMDGAVLPKLLCAELAQHLFICDAQGNVVEPLQPSDKWRLPEATMEWLLPMLGLYHPSRLDENEVKAEPVTTIKTSQNTVVAVADPTLVKKIWAEGLSAATYRFLKLHRKEDKALQIVLGLMCKLECIDTGVYAEFHSFMKMIGGINQLGKLLQLDKKECESVYKTLASAARHKYALKSLLADIDFKSQKGWSFYQHPRLSIFYKNEISRKEPPEIIAKISRRISWKISEGEKKSFNNVIDSPNDLDDHWSNIKDDVANMFFKLLKAAANEPTLTSDTQSFCQTEARKYFPGML